MDDIFNARDILQSVDADVFILDQNYIIIYSNKNINMNKSFLEIYHLDQQNIYIDGRKIEHNINGITHVITFAQYKLSGYTGLSQSGYTNLLIVTVTMSDIRRKYVDFLASISHEIRNSLQVIFNMTYFLQQHHFTEKHVEMISKSSNDIKKIISDTLDLNKLDEHTFEVEYKMVNVSQLIHDIMYDLHAKSINITHHMDPSVPTCIHTDELRVKQILMNIISNAIKYTKTYVHIDVFWIEQSSDTKYISFVISDDGIGIKVDEINNLFKLYGKTTDSNNDLTKKSKFDGNGLGLYISKRIARVLKGDIFVESTFGNGCKFTLSLPVKPQ